MVLLRLTVKVFPREQLGQPSMPDGGANGDVVAKATTFLIVVWHPEQVTLGKLAYLIQEKWKKLKPDAGPLEIKKLVDDKHEEDTLDAELTVAEVFVDSGKALADGLDQRGVIRVIQQPGRPERYGSVVQDWAAVTNNYARAPPPLFSDPPRNEAGPTIARFAKRPVAGPSHPAPFPESDCAPRSIESCEARPNRPDNHTYASPILVEDSQRPISFTSAGKSWANDERTTSTEIRASVAWTQEDEVGYGGTIMDALRYDYAKQEAAMHDMDRQASLRASLPTTRTLAQQSSPSHPQLRSTSSTNNISNVAGPKKRQVEADDIYAIPSTDQESKNSKKPQPTKRRRRNISGGDEFTMQNNFETLLASPGDGVNNAIILDSDVGEGKLVGQAQREDGIAPDSQSGVRRGTRKSNIRGPGRKSMALKTPFTPPENVTSSAQRPAAATKTLPKKKTPVTVADSDIEIIDGPKPAQPTSGGVGDDYSSPETNSVVGRNRDGGHRNVANGANIADSTKKCSTPMSSTYQPTHLDAKTSEPIYSDIPESDISDDAGVPSSGPRNTTQVTTPRNTPQKPASAPADRHQASGNGRAPNSHTQNGLGALELTTDSDNNSGRPSYSSPSRPRGPHELGLGITASASKRGRSVSMSQPATVSDGNRNYRTGVSTTPAFPRPRPASQVEVERRGSVFESEKASSGGLRTPLMPALRSSQKPSPRTGSTRRSVSFVDDQKIDKLSTPASSSSVKVGSIMYPAGVAPEWVEWMRTDGELRKKIDEARLQGKSEEYRGCVETVKYLTEKLYDASSKKSGSQIAKFERKLKRAEEILRNHPENDHPAEDNVGDGHHEKNQGEEDEHEAAKQSDKDVTFTANGSRNKPQGLAGLDGTSQEDSPDIRKAPSKDPADNFPSRASLAPPSIDTPLTGSLAITVSSPSGTSNGASGNNVEEEATFKEGNSRKRKRPESESVNSPNSSKHRRSNCDPHASEPGLLSKKTNANISEQERLGQREQRNGKAPSRDVGDASPHVSSSESSSSGSDSDSESDSNLMRSTDRINKRPSLPPCGGSARRSLITPFRDLKKTWPKTGQWLSDEASGAENPRTTGTVGSGTPSFSQPTHSTTNLENSGTNGGFHTNERATLKTLIWHQKGSGDESNAMNASENDSLPGSTSNRYTGYNILRRAGLY